MTVEKKRIEHGSIPIEKSEVVTEGFDIDLTRKQAIDLVGEMKKGLQDSGDGEYLLTVVRDGDKLSLRVSTKRKELTVRQVWMGLLCLVIGWVLLMLLYLLLNPPVAIIVVP